MIKEYLIQLVALATILGPMIGIAFKWKSENKKENSVILGALRENRLQSEQAIELINDHLKETNFDKKLMSVFILRETTMKLRMPKKFHPIIKEWCRQLYVLADGYYYHSFRGIDYEIRDYIIQEITDIEDNIKNLVRSNIYESKQVKLSPTREINVKFYDWFVKEENAAYFQLMKVLQTRLIENGFDRPGMPKSDENKDYINHIAAALKCIMDSFLNVIESWNKLDKND
jgi:hypothetical protein